MPGLEAYPQLPAENQDEEADQRVRPNPVRQAVEDRGDLDFGFEYPEATLDVDNCLVAADDLGRGMVRHVGDQDQPTGRPAHHPFRGLLSVHSHYGLQGRQVT